MIVHDAAAVFVDLIHAALWWARAIGAAFAFTVCVVAFAAGPLIALRVETAQKRLSGRVTVPEPAKAALEPHESTNAPRARTELPARRVPAWAHTEPHNYEETKAA